MNKEQQIQSFDRSIGRIIRFTNQLLRASMSETTTTVQQYFVLDVISAGPRAMSDLASEVAMHQSTLTRIVEKLEKQELLIRSRKPGNQRSVEVRITEKGKSVWEYLSDENNKLMTAIYQLVPENKQSQVVEALEIISNLISPENEQFLALVESCCSNCKA